MSGESFVVGVEATHTLFGTSGQSLPGNCDVLLGVKRDVMALSADCIMPG